MNLVHNALAEPIPSSIALPGYQIIEQLYTGSRTLVYRAVRQVDLQPVVIKLLKNEHPSFSELVQFRNQYTIAKNLNSSGIIQPYHLEPYHNGYALIMEDFGGVSLSKYVREKAEGRQPLSLPVADFLAIALQLCDILHNLYQQQVIHKDIKPANILINTETRQVKLIDFSIASLLPRETLEIQSPNILEGTLAYLSPEQTGRMNRGIDYRSDFYSLGVTFYELLTGQLPFRVDEPLELIHCHIAKHPSAVHSLNSEIPAVLSAIVGKLMAKNAENRYQSTFGLKHDLKICLEQWQQGRMDRFEIGQRDVCDRFLIPETLHGRQSEVQMLLDAFERVAGNGEWKVESGSELMLVAGFSGIGKTAVVNEVHKPIVRQRGYFIKGKFDQFQRNIPLSAFVQAFRDLMGQLLSETDAQLAQWKTNILAALGENAQVIIEVIPELERILGTQPSVPELSGSAAQNRFDRLLQQFIQVFTTAAHPLVIFIDDLQWADSASLSMMRLLMGEAHTRCLLFIGAYRDNEVTVAHPLMLSLEEIQKSGATVNTMTLAPLTQASVNQLVADTLSCSLALAAPLTALIVDKTGGNPFFTTQFLKALYDDRLITFNGNENYWECDITQLRSLTLTDDIVAFMATQLQKLPAPTQAVLKLAACIGNQFDLNTLAIVSEQSEVETAAVLWRALQEGLVIPQSEVYKFYQAEDAKLKTQDSKLVRLSAHDEAKAQNCFYRFLHDRVQQAAYSLIPDDQKQITHLQIGRLLQHATTEREQDEHLFAIVNHLNQGASLIEDEPEQQELVQLNRLAGQKAKSATAYEAALNYFNTGISLLRDDRWQRQYDLTLSLYEGAANAAYLSTDFEQMEQLAAVMLTQSRCWLDRINIYETKIQACMAQNQQLEALRLAREVLEQLGVPLPEQPTQADVGQAIQHTQALLGGRAIESLLELPQMTAPNPKAAMVILSRIISAAYQAAPNLLLLIILAHIDLSVKYGNALESANGYVLFGLIQIAVLEDIAAGCRFGKLGMNLSQRIHAPKLTSRTIFGFNCLLRHWQEPAKETLEGYLQAYTSGLEVGDIEYAAMSLTYYDLTAYYSGQELFSLKREIETHCKIVQQLRQETYLYTQRIYCQAIANLLEMTAEPDRLHGEYCNEAETIPLLLETNDMTALYCIYFNKLLLSYLFQRHEQALENASLAEQYLGATAGLIYVPLFSFYDALVRLAIYPTASETDQAVILDRVAAHQEKLSQWAVHAPSNQAHRWALVAAERCRVRGERAEAIDLYDRAICLANEHKYGNEAAIANELAAKFYLEWGKERIAQEYLIEAYYGYARWGAKAKIVDLETRYPQLLAPILQPARAPLSINETVFASGTVTSLGSASSVSDALDLAVILKASRTLSSEIELGKLLSSLLQLMIENAGADKCVLLLRDGSQSNTPDERLLVKGLATVEAEPTVLQRIPMEESQDIPLKLIYRVKNCLTPVILMDANADTEFAADPYFLRQQPKSILCSPILHQGRLLGIAYLENSLTINAFTGDLVHVLNLLCAQASISLEHAWLYKQAQDHAQELEQSLEKLRASEISLAKEREFLNAIIHTITDGIVVCDANGNLILFNEATRKFHGLSGEALPPEQWAEHFDLYQPDGKTPLSKTEIPLFRALQGEIVENAEMIIAPKQGSPRFLLASGQAIFDPVGNKMGAVVVLRDVSDRKQAEQQLQESQQVLQLVLNTIPHRVFWKDLNLVYQGCNQSFADDAGVGSPTEIVGKTDYDNLTWTPQEADFFRACDRRVMESNTPEFNIVEPQLQADGTTAWLETNKLPFHDVNGSVIGVIGIYQNITARKQAEAELYASRQRLSWLIQQSPLAIIEWDTEFRVRSWNLAAEHIFGFTTAEAIGRSIAFLVPQATQFHVDQIMAHLLSQQGGSRSINENLTKAGNVIVCDWYNSLVVSETGEVIGAASMALDITEARRAEDIRKQAEAALQEQEQFLRSIYDGVELVIAVVDRSEDGSFRYAGWNTAAEKASGIPSVDAVGKTLTEIHGERDGAILQQRFADCVQRGMPISQETSLTFANQEKWFFATYNPLKNEDGWIYRLVVTTIEVSDRKRAETQLNQRTTELEQTLQELQRTQTQMVQSEKMSGLGQLVAGVAHEINNPVNFIYGNLNHATGYTQDLLGLLQLYQQHYPTPHADIQHEIAAIDLEFLTGDLPKLLTSMKVGADRIQKIVASLRNFSRMDEADMKEVNIHEGIDSTLMILQHRLKARTDSPSIEIIKAYGELPLVECYAGQLNQVFMNLLSNAIDALDESMGKGEGGRGKFAPSPTITIHTALLDNQQITIQITDNGVGIPNQVKQRLFDPFFTTKPVGKGTGMGLSISYQIVAEKHKGTLRCVSELGEGTTFTIIIPIRQG